MSSGLSPKDGTVSRKENTTEQRSQSSLLSLLIIQSEAELDRNRELFASCPIPAVNRQPSRPQTLIVSTFGLAAGHFFLRQRNAG